MHQKMVTDRIEFFNQKTQADDLGARPQHSQDFHGSVINLAALNRRDDFLAMEGTFQMNPIPDVTDEIAENRRIEACLAHFMLFQPITAVNDHLGRFMFLEQSLDELLAEGAGSTRDQNYLIVEERHCFILYDD
jgi:hypothetical protein